MQTRSLVLLAILLLKELKKSRCRQDFDEDKKHEDLEKDIKQNSAEKAENIYENVEADKMEATLT